MKVLPYLACAIAILIASPAPAETAQMQSEGSFQGTATLKVGYRYLQTLPDGYAEKADKRWPLILFLHGSGERGDNLEVLKKHGPPKLIAAGQKFEAVVVSPQVPSQHIWDPHAVKALTDHLISTLRIDTDRVYLTGLSMGGFGTWDTAIEYPDTYAAIIPICGGTGVRWVMADRIKSLPIWIFHGEKDTTVEPAFSKKIYEALKKHGSNVQLTLYPNASHDSWTATYDDPKVWQWLFEQRRAGK
jgi:predicted peptidase